MSFYTVIQIWNQTALCWFSTYPFRPSYPFRPLIHSALIDSDVAKQPLNVCVLFYRPLGYSGHMGRLRDIWILGLETGHGHMLLIGLADLGLGYFKDVYILPGIFFFSFLDQRSELFLRSRVDDLCVS
ncbi:hypothetical protein Hanom_Chr10g00951091 [Helianthus anomalus]